LKILLTGHTGFIGTSIVQRFSYDYAFVVTSPNSHQRVNVLDKKDFESLERVDSIIHLAAKTSISDSICNSYEVYNTNFTGTLNILDYAVTMGIKNIINLSTYIYGNPRYLPIDESHPVNPHSPYNKSKFIAEQLCEFYSNDKGINIVTLRPFYVYGPSQKSSFVTIGIQKTFRNEIMRLSKRGTRRDFLYIDDFLDLINKILIDFPEGYNVYNVGYGESYSLEDILRIIEDITGKKVHIEYDLDIRPNDVSQMVANIEKVKERFGWQPKIDIREGMKSTIDRYLKEGLGAKLY
jgi:UDP-glucose 4-epimerase